VLYRGAIYLYGELLGDRELEVDERDGGIRGDGVEMQKPPWGTRAVFVLR
jgi:hypothetical protein